MNSRLVSSFCGVVEEGLGPHAFGARFLGVFCLSVVSSSMAPNERVFENLGMSAMSQRECDEGMLVTG